ncbi:MAG: ComEC/Rec2 family competence protein [Janthinobacterium lividum]
MLYSFGFGVWLLQQQTRLPVLRIPHGFMGLPSVVTVMIAATLLLGFLAAALMSRRMRAKCGGLASSVPTLLSQRARALLVALIASCLAGVAGFSWAAWRAQTRLGEMLPSALEGRPLRVDGSITGLPSRFAHGLVFDLQVDPMASPRDAPFLKNLRVAWYSRPRRHAAAGARPALPELLPGQRWRLLLNLKRPRGTANFGGFDREAALFARGVGATGYVVGRFVPRRLPAASDGMAALRAGVDRQRLRIGARIDAVLPAAPHVGLVKALAVGDQRDVSAADKLLFRATGTSHLLAISGLHVGLIASGAGWLVGGIWRRSRLAGYALPLVWPSHSIQSLAAALAAAGYVLLSGSGIPAQRAFWMLCAVCVARASGRAVGASLVLGWALALVLIVDPWAVLSTGFWLSFGAVAVLLYAASTTLPEAPGLSAESPMLSVASDMACVDAGSSATVDGAAVARVSASAGAACAERAAAVWQRHCRAWRQRCTASARMQFAVTFALLPASAFWFSQVSLISPLANAFAIPWVSFVVVPSTFAGALLPAPFDAWLLTFAHASLRLLCATLAACAAPDWAAVQMPRPSVTTLLLACFGVLWWLAPASWPLRRAAPLLWLPLVGTRIDAPPPGEFQVTVLDVGQGGAAVVETAAHRLLFDAGPSFGDGDAGQMVVLPFLRARGIRELDLMVVSHRDDDHAGGAATILQGLPIGSLRASLPYGHRLWRAATAGVGVDAGACGIGQSWEWDGVRFTFMWPDAGSAGFAASRPNWASCVLRVDNGRHAALLTADIEAPQERALARGAAAPPAANVRLPAELLLAPHHGSKTSSTPLLVNAVAPAEVVFQVGYRNRFGHPAPRVVGRYQAAGASLHRSDRDGQLIFRTDGSQLRTEAYRRTHRAYWNVD